MIVYVCEDGKPSRVLVLSPDATVADMAAAIPQAVPVARVPDRMPRGAMVVRVREGGGMEWVSMKLERNTPCC